MKLIEKDLTPASFSFFEKLKENDVHLTRCQLTSLQVNIGKRCNQACHHCHVESTPLRTENMSTRTVDRLLQLLSEAPQVETVDITGGAPELNPNFRYFVKEIRSMGKKVIDRCNLTVFFEPGQEDTPQFLRDHQVEIVASLPCYTKDNVDKQRGRGVFNKSVEALKILNALGYGRKESGLVLNLVYNPLGAFLPPAQESLEKDYKQKLKEDINIEFNHLFTITNMPIKRFLNDLQKQGKLEEYMEVLLENFNPHAAENVMCRDLVSVGWDGLLYDCDFNQMLEVPISTSTKSIFSINSLSELNKEGIAVGNHCYACTAGSGSSCGGATI